MKPIWMHIVEDGILALPFICFVWAFWSWQKSDKSTIKPWRRILTKSGLTLVFAACCLAGFSLVVLYERPEPGPWLPDLTIKSMEIGFLVGVAGLLASIFAKSWTRIALILSSLGVLLVFYLIALSP